MIRVALLGALVTLSFAQNLEDCSSGGPEFWCASCQNAEACSALIPGLVAYCEQIGIFNPGMCADSGIAPPTDPVTVLPTTAQPTAAQPTDAAGSDGSLPINIVPQPNPPSREEHPFPEDTPLIPPFIEIKPVNITVPPGATAQFKCASSGAPAPTITIMAQDEALDSYSPPTIEEKELAREQNPDQSNVNIIQEIEDVTKEHEGWYTCMAGNVQGAVYADAYLRVLDLCGTITCDAPKVCEADYILGTAECVCQECSTEFDVICGYDCNTYFNPCQLDQLNCQQGSDIGIWTKGMCPATERPVIIDTIFTKGQTDGGFNLKGGPTSIHMVNEGDSFTLRCEAAGAPEPMLSWYMDGVLVSEGPEHAVSGADFMKDAGMYECYASNCVNGGDKEMITVSEKIQVIVEEVEPVEGDALGIPCQVFGDPHIVTFDNKLYDYMGDCNYVLSMDCDWGAWVIYGNFKACGPDLGYPASCLIDVTVFWNSIGLNLQRGWIVVYNGEKVALKYNGEVMVEDIKIKYDGLYITVELPNGIIITWDGIISTQVILPIGYSDTSTTCGLCGSHDKNPDNDYRQRFIDDNVTDGPEQFGNSWEIDRMDTCDAIEDQLSGEAWCEMYPERKEEGDVRCPEVFGNAVFDACRPYLSTDGYVEKCKYDMCALDELRDILLADCGVAAAYVQQCKALSGIHISADRWRAAVDCPTVAEHQNSTVATGCPQETNPWNNF